MTSNQIHEQFVRLLAANQGRIHAYIMSMVFDWSTTEEIFQETCVVLWQKFDQFDPDTDFLSWAFQIARYKTLQWREKQARRKEYCNDEFLQTVCEVQAEMSDELDRRGQALAKCLKRLSEEDRELLRLRYTGDHRAKEIARQVSRSTDAVYKALQRIRRSLQNCIRMRLAQEESL